MRRGIVGSQMGWDGVPRTSAIARGSCARARAWDSSIGMESVQEDEKEPKEFAEDPEAVPATVEDKPEMVDVSMQCESLSEPEPIVAPVVETVPFRLPRRLA